MIVLDAIALVLLIIWAVGILLNVSGTIYVYKTEDHPLHDSLHRLLDDAGTVSVLVLLTVLIVSWPAGLIYSLITKNRK